MKICKSETRNKKNTRNKHSIVSCHKEELFEAKYKQDVIEMRGMIERLNNKIGRAFGLRVCRKKFIPKSFLKKHGRFYKTF